MRSRLQIEGLREARHRVDAVGERARRPEPALRAPGTKFDLQMSERRRFSIYRFKPATKVWVARKRAEGLDTRTMHASNRLASALENAEGGSIRLNVFNATLTWGLRQGRPGDPGFYAKVQAGRGRRAVVIDRTARRNITERVEAFLATGFIEH